MVQVSLLTSPTRLALCSFTCSVPVILLARAEFFSTCRFVVFLLLFMVFYVATCRIHIPTFLLVFGFVKFQHGCVLLLGKNDIWFEHSTLSVSSNQRNHTCRSFKKLYKQFSFLGTRYCVFATDI